MKPATMKPATLAKRGLKGKICIYGAGVMGTTLARTIISNKIYPKDSLWAVTKSELSATTVERELSIKCINSNYRDLLAQTRIVILAVKPGQVKDALAELKKEGVSKDTLFISIATGVSLAELEGGLPAKMAIIRAVTNTPLFVGEGMTALCPGKHATTAHINEVQKLFECAGKCIELDESLCEAMTGLSACGPAYLYLIMEALADGGVRVGLPRDTAIKVVAQTVLGAANMVLKSGRHPASLRDDVTTPAGCTIGALLVMEDGKIRSVLARAVEEATKIAKELGKS